MVSYGRYGTYFWLYGPRGSDRISFWIALKVGFREDAHKVSDKFGDGCAEGAVLPERDELDEEKPVVVVVNEGDLTESEARVIEKRLKKGCEDSVIDNEDGEGNH